MSNLHCICVYATDGQWLLLKILFWFAFAVFLGHIILIIFWNIQDGLERRQQARRHHHLSRRTTDVEERFEEIHDD